MNEYQYEYYVREFNKTELKGALELYEKASAKRTEFLQKFPKESLETLPMEGYLFAKSGYGRGDTFCCWVYSKLNEIATTGNLRPDIFGIYYRNGNELSLSRTFKREYDNDFEAAYNEIRRQIVWLLEDVSMDKYDVIEKVDLAKPFVYKTLVVYFPDKFLPICVKKMMEEVCVAMDLPFSDKKKVILYDNIKLREMKEEHQSIRYWDNETFLGFCRYEHMVRAENCRKTAMSV